MVRPSNRSLSDAQIEADKKARGYIESILSDVTSTSTKKELRTAAKVFKLAEALNHIDSGFEPVRWILAGENKWSIDFFADQGME